MLYTLSSSSSSPLSYLYIIIKYTDQVCKGREWQLDQIHQGFRHGHTLLSDFLGLFPGGPSRRRLLSGQEVTTRQLMEIISFEGGGGGGKYPHQPEMIRRVIGELRDEEAQLFFRTATGEWSHWGLRTQIGLEW